VDIPYGIRAFKRSSGEYTVFVEDDAFAKVIMYRWCPSGNCPEISSANRPSKLAPESSRPGLNVRAIDKGVAIGFDARGKYTVAIYSVSGGQIAEYSSTSTGRVTWRTGLTSGVYLVTLFANGSIAVCSMVCR
jgi:hypothetical protein